jgi:hypothetical protein
MNIDDDVIGGIPFMKDNSIIVDAANDTIIFKDKSDFCYTSPSPNSKGIVRRAQAHVLRSGTTKVTVFPGDYIELPLPTDLHHEKHPIVVEPHPDLTNAEWPSPRLLRPVNGKVRIVNDTSETFCIPRKQHFCQAMAIDSDTSTSRKGITPLLEEHRNNRFASRQAIRRASPQV